MKILKEKTTNEIVDAIKRSPEAQQIDADVRAILENVKNKGDEALINYTKKFDGIEKDHIQIMNRDDLTSYVEQTKTKLTDLEIEAIDTAIKNINFVALNSTPQDWSATAAQGQIVGERFTPYNRVACYVPQGSFPLVSTAIHTAAIAKSVGVNEIVMITSPKSTDLNPAVAYAAFESGVTEIVFVGGAQGIAALAYGTQSIEKADFICGPGNAYVAKAKQLLFGEVGIDMVAGPSEVFVLADETADSYSIACDLVAQAEHGSGLESSVLLSPSAEIISKVEKELHAIKPQIKNNPGFERVFENSIYLVQTQSMEQAIDITNQCAPEHVEVMTSNAKKDAQQVRNAGAIFIGHYSAEPLGDFVAGPSHVLPTNSTARFTSGLSAASFMKRTSIIEINEKSYSELAHLAEVFGHMEGLTGHALSSIARIEKNT